MTDQEQISRIEQHLHMLCTVITDRRVGGEGNREATAYFRDILRKNNWHAESTTLEVMDWATRGASLRADSEHFEVFSAPYSPGCSVNGDLAAVSTVVELETAALKNKIVLLHGDIAKEQVIPKNFVFYNPDEHKRIVSLLEDSGVKAIVSATGLNPALAGGLYPFPLFEDGDFDIPSVYMKDTEGDKLLNSEITYIELVSEAERIHTTAYNVLGKKAGNSGKRIVVTAHIDAKIGTPGAIDNATGVAVLLHLAELLQDYRGQHALELVAFNGEDYYAVPGR